MQKVNKPQVCWVKNRKGLYVKPKASYASKDEAQRVHSKMRPYQCGQCGKWHLTSQEQR